MNRPYVLINVAVTVDGKMDTVERRGAAISSARDKERVDGLRAEADALMVGERTVLGDDPRLTVKSPARRAERARRGLSENPAKVAVVSRADLRLDSQFVNAGPARVIVLTTARAAPEQIGALRARGVEVYPLGETQVDLRAALARLKKLGIRRLLVEGGGTLNFELLRLGLVDELQMYVAPLIFGGESAPTLAAGPGLPRAQALAMPPPQVEAWDDGGVLLRYQLKAGGASASVSRGGSAAPRQVKEKV